MANFRYNQKSLNEFYNIKDPNNNKVTSYYRNIQNKPFAYWEKEKYTGTKGNKKFDLKLNNKIFNYVEYQEDGNILNKTSGIYEVHKDTIQLRTLVKYNSGKGYDFETPLPVNNDFKKRYFIILYNNKIQELEDF